MKNEYWLEIGETPNLDTIIHVNWYDAYQVASLKNHAWAQKILQAFYQEWFNEDQFVKVNIVI